MIQAHERRAADGVDDGVVDVAHGVKSNGVCNNYYNGRLSIPTFIL